MKRATNGDGIRLFHGFLLLAASAALATGCTGESSTDPASTTTTAASIDLDADPEANLDIGSDTLVVAGAGASLPGEVSASSGLGSEFTVHLRCLGDTNVRLVADDATIDQVDALACDGQEHDLEVSLDADANALAIIPETDDAEDGTSWVAAVTSS